MRLLLLGRSGSVTHWLEEAASAWRAEGHEVRVAFVRRPWLATGVEASLAGPFSASLVRRVRRSRPDLILVIGGFHAPLPILQAVAELPARPPLVGWVGDMFDASAAAAAALYDVVAYTDSGLEARHRRLGFRAQAVFLPHAADPSGDWPWRRHRIRDTIFAANPTPHRRAIVSEVIQPLTLIGPGWSAEDGAHHHRRARRISSTTLRLLYGAHLASLNIRNESHVLSGLNQRNFAPLLAGSALITDDQPDLTRCFEPGREVLVWRDAAELNDHDARLRTEPAFASALADRGRRRVLADHTYGRRLAAISALL